MPSNAFDLDQICAHDCLSVELGRVHNTKFTTFMLLRFVTANGREVIRITGLT